MFIQWKFLNEAKLIATLLLLRLVRSLIGVNMKLVVGISRSICIWMPRHSVPSIEHVASHFWVFRQRYPTMKIKVFRHRGLHRPTRKSCTCTVANENASSWQSWLPSNPGCWRKTEEGNLILDDKRYGVTMKHEWNEREEKGKQSQYEIQGPFWGHRSTGEGVTGFLCSSSGYSAMWANLMLLKITSEEN